MQIDTTPILVALTFYLNKICLKKQKSAFCQPRWAREEMRFFVFVFFCRRHFDSRNTHLSSPYSLHPPSKPRNTPKFRMKKQRHKGWKTHVSKPRRWEKIRYREGDRRMCPDAMSHASPVSSSSSSSSSPPSPVTNRSRPPLCPRGSRRYRPSASGVESQSH